MRPRVDLALALLATLLVVAPATVPDLGAHVVLAESVQAARAGDVLPSVGAPYDLERDEKLGGHTIARHVGKTDDELRARLRQESQISAASTYSDLTTARRVVGAAVEQSRSRIREWASRTGPRPNLVLNYAEPGGRSIGRSLRRGARITVSAGRALVVLRWLPREARWIVLTSYPEAR